MYALRVLHTRHIVKGWGTSHTAASPRTWSGTITVSGKLASKCTLWTNLAPAAKLEARQVDRLSRLSVSHLKSILQKNVRRGRAEAAVRCAAELGLKSWEDLVRRVSIIALEDSMLHPALPLLTWLMGAAGKGYCPPVQAVAAVLAVVHEIASCPIHDSMDVPMQECRDTPAPSPSTLLNTLGANIEGALCRRSEQLGCAPSLYAMACRMLSRSAGDVDLVI
jgi:hypothetical protein